MANFRLAMKKKTTPPPPWPPLALCFPASKPPASPSCFALSLDTDLEERMTRISALATFFVARARDNRVYELWSNCFA